MDSRELVILPMEPGLADARLAPMPLRDHAFLYVECDVPDGVTLESWRAAKAAPRRSRLDGLLRRSRERGGHAVDRSAGRPVRA